MRCCLGSAGGSSVACGISGLTQEVAFSWGLGKGAFILLHMAPLCPWVWAFIIWYPDQNSFQPGQWFPREQKQKLPGLLRAKPVTGLIITSATFYCQNKSENKPRFRGGEVASNFLMKQHCVQGWYVGSHICILTTKSSACVLPQA